MTFKEATGRLCSTARNKLSAPYSTCLQGVQQHQQQRQQQQQSALFRVLAGHEIMLLFLLLLSTFAAAAADDDNALTTSGKCIEKAKTEKLFATATATTKTAAETEA